MRMNLRSLGFLALVVLLSFAVFAQGPQLGSLTGTVTDPSGAVVPNAQVTVTNANTGLSRSMTTTGSGAYVIGGLPPGIYNVRIAAPGFGPFTSRAQVTVGGTNTLDARLALEASSTTVEVVGAGGVAVNTENQQVSEVVNSQQIANLPTLTRNPYDLVATASNVSQDSQAGMGDLRGAGYAINGQRSASTDILLDGMENVDQFTATPGQVVPLDSIQEFRVVSNGMTAQYGRASGGIVDVATKSGTNAFHGSVYEYNRISALASNTYENAANGVPKPRFDRNQFGFSVGGPIMKNKLFFFNNTEWIRVRSPAEQVTSVVNPAFLALAAPATQAFFSTFGKLRPDLTSIGTITAGQVNFTPGPLFSALPAGTPVLDLVSYRTNNDAGAGFPQNTLMTVGRVDVNVSDKTQLFARYALFDERDLPGVINTSPYAGFETAQTNYDQNAMLSVTHSFTTTFLSNTRLVWNRLNNVQPLGTNPAGPTLYLSNSRAGRVNGRLVAFPGYNEYTPGSAIPFGGPQNVGQVFEDMSWTRGNHTLRFGGQYIRTQDNRAFGAYEEAVEGLSTSSIGTAFDNFLAGKLAVFQAAVFPQGKFPCPVNLTTGKAIVSPSCTVTLPVTQPNFSRSNLYNDSALYAQDTWKIFPTLTLDLGLRWEYYGVQHNRDPNLDSNFYYGAGSNFFEQIRNGFVTTVPNSPIGSLWKPSYRNFAPRVGFAWDVFGNGKTSLRGGYGIGYERNFNNVTFNVIQNPPNYAVLALTPTNVGGIIPVTTSNAGPLGGSTGSKALGPTSLRNVDEFIKTAYAEQWSLNVERQVGANAVFTIGYNGSRGIHQYGISNNNDPGFGSLYLGDPKNSFLIPQYSAINNRGSNGDSWYNGLSTSIRGRVWRDLQLAASYTWSHSIDTLSSTFSDEVQNNGLGYLDPFNPKLDKASSDYDARHRVSISFVWSLPFSNSSSALLRNTIGGFQFAPIFTFHSGYPFTIFDCSNSGAFFNCPRADVSGAVPVTGTTNTGDIGNNLFNYLSVPAIVGDYAGPTVIPGTSTPMPVTSSTLPTCTGLVHQGCSFPANMLHRNSSIGPNVWNWDLGVYKNFKITERLKLQLRGEFYDVINHKNFYVLGFGQGGADVSSLPTNAAGLPVIQMKKGGFGNPFDDHRNTQLAIRFEF